MQAARAVSDAIRAAGIDACVIGGVAVFLHGYARTTTDVDVLSLDNLQELHHALARHGFVWHAKRREFSWGDVPIHLVEREFVGETLGTSTEIDRIRTLDLPNLLTIKLRSGTKNVLRAIDLADAIGLIRHHRLTSKYATRLSKDVRPAFRSLVKAIQRERN